MKTFYQWINESEEINKDVSIHQLITKRKKLFDQLKPFSEKFYRNGWSRMSTDEIETKYPTHRDVKAYRQLNDKINELNDQIEKLNMQ